MRGAIIIGFLLLTAAAFSDEIGLTVSGTVTNLRGGDLYLYLVDEETSRRAFCGIRELTIPATECEGRESIAFRFDGLPPGDYGVRCFQDQNGNGKLDRGLFGPREPWGLSWKEPRASEWPRFADFSFGLDSNQDDIHIVLE